MPTLTLTVEYQTEGERAAFEQAVAFVAEMRQLAQSAPDGHVLDACEAHALEGGRRLLRATLQAAAQGRIDRAEERGAPRGPARAPAGTA